MCCIGGSLAPSKADLLSNSERQDPLVGFPNYSFNGNSHRTDVCPPNLGVRHSLEHYDDR